MGSLGFDFILFDFDALFANHDKFPDIIVPEINLKQFSISFTKLIIPDITLDDLAQIPDDHIISKATHDILFSCVTALVEFGGNELQIRDFAQLHMLEHDGQLDWR
jgi:hypothetical protein